MLLPLHKISLGTYKWRTCPTQTNFTTLTAASATSMSTDERPLQQFSTMATKRLAKEWKRMQDDGPFQLGYTMIPTNDSLSEWQVTMTPGEHSYYAGGTFTAKLIVSSNYPYEMPEVRFETPIYHPNISGNGAIVHFVEGEWTNVMTLESVVLNLIALMNEPNTVGQVDEPNVELLFRAEVAKQWDTDRETFAAHAQEWVQKYAIPSNSQADKGGHEMKDGESGGGGEDV